MIGLATLAVLIALLAGAVWRASRIVNDLLGDWATSMVSERSGGVYSLELGRMHFEWARHRVSVHSVRLRTRPLTAAEQRTVPVLRLALDGCIISGVSLVTLIRRAGLVARSFGCRAGNFMVEVPSGDSAAPRAAPPLVNDTTGQRAFRGFQESLSLPAYAPRIRIARIDFPQLALGLRLPGSGGRATRLDLGRLRWRMTDFAIDPADPAAATRPLFSRTVELVAQQFTTRIAGGGDAIHVELLRAGLGDSTLDVRGLGLESAPDSARPPRMRGLRRSVVALSISGVSARGMDFGGLIFGAGIRARRVTIDSLLLRITNDKRRPPGPPKPRRTPQRWIADLDAAFIVDSLVVRSSAIVYREYAPGRDRPGVFTLGRIDATAMNVQHRSGPRSSAAVTTITARARLQDAGRLELRATVALDAPRFDLRLAGTLGAMPAASLNRFLAATNALRIERGQVAGATMAMVVRNGVATGTVTPLFTDLSVSVTRTGSDGMLGRGGIVGGAARRVANYAAGRMLRANNPARAGEAPRVGVIAQTFTPTQTLTGFLWSGVRGGLLSVIRK